MKKILAILTACASILTACAFSGCDLLNDLVSGSGSDDSEVILDNNGTDESDNNSSSGGNSGSSGNSSSDDNSSSGGNASSDGNESSGDSDVVTEDEWRAAFSDDKMLNLTMEESEYYDNISYEAHNFFKIALTDNSSFISGTVYQYCTIKEGDEIIFEGYYTYSSASNDAVYYNDTNGITKWYGYSESVLETDEIDIFNYSYAAYYLKYLLLANSGVEVEMCDAYSHFTYENGAYVFEEEVDAGTQIFSVKIIDGYVTTISYELLVTKNVEFNVGDYMIDTVTFYDYGTTTVTIPEEFTYEYYLANNAN